jgi:predicted membrane-bound dolichyl-phosphate-mannose-protein mannosyltransferase
MFDLQRRGLDLIAPPRDDPDSRSRLLRSPVDRAGRLVRRAQGTFWRLVDAGSALPLLLLVGFVVRGAWLDLPPGGLIFDESYYVNAARVILGLAVPAGAPYADAPLGLDSNTEHPPLGKLLIAGSILVFGDHGLGWRLPSVVAGMVSLWAIYAIVVRLGAPVRIATAVLAILALENLTLVHSRIATLDVLALAPALLAAWLALGRRWALAGVALAVSVLVKLTGIYLAVGVVGFSLLELWPTGFPARNRTLTWLRPVVLMVVTFVVVAIAGLTVLDATVTSWPSPLDHFAHMIRYGAGLTSSVHSTVCTGAASAPWQWAFNQCEINYLRVDVTPPGQTESFATIAFRGALNPALAGTLILAVAFCVATIRRSADRTIQWTVVWMGANWLPYLVVSLVSDRVMYLYYLVATVPALAVATVLFLTRSRLPSGVVATWALAFVIGFLAYYPFRIIP